MPPDLTSSNRELIPLSSTLLGVQSSFANPDGARTVQVISGGYVDDIAEAYDNLRPTRSAEVLGSRVTVLTTDFMNRQVWLGYWRQSGVARPCDVHAVISRGLGEAEFREVLAGLG